MNLSFTSKAQQEALPTPTHVILASQSIGRKQMLEKLGVRFRVVVTQVNEDDIVGRDPAMTVKARAASKMNEILSNPKVYMLDEKVNNLIIAADSMAIFGKKAFGKAKDREDAKEIVRSLMGHTHIFMTAVAAAFVEKDWIVKKKWEKIAKTKVTMRKMSGAEIDSYVTRYDFSRFAGGYALNEAPWDLVSKVDGSYTNVIGLPFEIILPILKTHNIVV
jgi:septum formation protein